MSEQDKVLSILRVPSFRRKRVFVRYRNAARTLCKAFSDTAFSVREFEQQLNRVRRMLNNEKSKT